MDQTGDTIANEILLIRDKYSGPILLLEGDSDEKFFRRFVKDSEMIIIPAWGKENVVDATEILESCGSVHGFLGIVDADFGHLDGSLPTSRNVVVTDDHDVEMMIIKTEAFGAVLKEMGSREKIQDFTTSTDHEIRRVLIQRTLSVGHLRHLSITDDLRMRFEGLRFERFVDRKSLEIDIDKMIESVLALTGNSELQVRDIQNRLRIAKSTDNDPYQICCGHDFVMVFSLALRKVLGSKSKKATDPEALGTMLRLAYDSKDLRQTTLYMSVKRWSKQNPGYDIFE